MLPASKHIEIAELAIKFKCHLVTSSYYDPQYKKLEPKFIDNDCLFVCECGLDPGIDHLLAHKLIQEFDKENHQDIKSIDLKVCVEVFQIYLIILNINLVGHHLVF